jgi:SAM-dependent methyltransferase
MSASQIDWNDVWKNMMDRQGDEHQNRAELKKHWDSKENALAFLKRMKERPEIGGEAALQGFPLSPEFRVLDIGAGVGRIAIPMSKKVAYVTAVEPGKGMMEILKEQIAEHGITNITSVEKRWEDVDIRRDLEGPYDLVIAYQSLGMPDIRTAIKRMCDVSRKWVYLVSVNGIPTIEQNMIDLWPALHGCEYNVGPRGNVLFNLLYDMKIYPNVKSERWEYVKHYSTSDDIVNESRKQFRISTQQQEEILRDGLMSLLEKTDTGYIYRQSGNSVTFWWDVSKIDDE